MLDQISTKYNRKIYLETIEKIEKEIFEETILSSNERFEIQEKRIPITFFEKCIELGVGPSKFQANRFYNIERHNLWRFMNGIKME